MNNEIKSALKQTDETYQTLDKDYGRTKFAGRGYGEIDAAEYEQLEALINRIDA